MKESTLKGLFHAGLVVAALVEMRTATTNMRRLLLGACAGWHASAAYDHFVREPKQRKVDPPYISFPTWGNLDSLHDEEENG